MQTYCLLLLLPLLLFWCWCWSYSCCICSGSSCNHLVTLPQSIHRGPEIAIAHCRLYTDPRSNSNKMKDTNRQKGCREGQHLQTSSRGSFPMLQRQSASLACKAADSSIIQAASHLVCSCVMLLQRLLLFAQAATARFRAAITFIAELRKTEQPPRT